MGSEAPMSSLNFEIARLLARNGSIPGAQLRPNALTRATFRGNMNLQLSPLADVAVSTAFISSSQRLPQTENNALLHLFSAAPERASYGAAHYKLRSDDSSTLLGRIFALYR